MKIIKKPGKSKNVIVGVAISKKYYQNWEKYIYKNWKIYCDRFDLGLIIFDDFLDKSKNKKKANWHKLLVGKKINESKLSKDIKNICYLDVDILINSFGAPNIFDVHKNNKITVVHQYKNMPYDYMETGKRMSMFRHLFYSKKYPLDSSIFMTPKQVAKFHNFRNAKKMQNYFCSGLFIFNHKIYSKFLEKIYEKYDKKFISLTGGDEPIMNYEFQKTRYLNWIDYKYQAIWVYEMANKFPFLYDYGKKNKKLQSECVTSSLMSNYFLHFCGSWHESYMINLKNNYLFNRNRNLIKNFYKYKKVIPKAQARGLIKP